MNNREFTVAASGHNWREARLVLRNKEPRWLAKLFYPTAVRAKLRIAVDNTRPRILLQDSCQFAYAGGYPPENRAFQ